MLYELLYTSAADKSLSDEGLAQLLAESRKNNAAADVTGLLIYHNREFVQLLEGEKSQVEAIYEKIAVDNRHTCVTVFWDGKIERRSFREWVMAYIDTENINQNYLDGHATIFKQDILLSDILVDDIDNTGKDLVLSLGKQILGCPGEEPDQASG